MNIGENIRIAVYSIRTNMMRSLLTMLGIIIGVASVIAIITVGNGGRDYIVGMIRSLGSNTVSITVNTSNVGASDYISREDLTAIKNIDSVEYVSPIAITIGNASTKRESGLCYVISGTTDLKHVMSAQIKYGRFFNEEEYASTRPVAVIPVISAVVMFGYENCVGEEIVLNANDKIIKAKIIGVFESAMMGDQDSSSILSSSNSLMGSSSQAMCMLMMPATTTDALVGSSGLYDMIYLTSTTDDNLDTAGNAAANVLYSRHGNFGSEAYNVMNMATYINLLDTVIRVFTAFIAAVSAISLVVGGIGVMNIMLVSVTERTREIGIRKALGAKTTTILFQFLTESIILCMIGGTIGFAIGVGGAIGVSAYMKIPMDIELTTVLIAVGFSSAIGVFFGIYPAKRAADMPPIEALRRE